MIRLLPVAALASACTGPEVYFENDALFPRNDSDRNYTSGTRLDYTLTAEEAQQWYRDFVGLLVPWADAPPTEVGLTLGQQIYTPQDIEAVEPDPNDRPYAAWLHTGLTRYDTRFDADAERARDSQIATSLFLGVVGPEAGGEGVQHLAHELVDADEPMGWDSQLDTEVTAMLSVRRKDRVWRGEFGVVSADVLTTLAASAGTPKTQAEAGALLRLGLTLPRDFGVSTIESSQTTSAASRRERDPLTFHFFGGAVGRAVAYDVFLDGNTFQDSPSVDREPFVGDLLGGIALQWGSFRLSYTAVARSAEFDGPDADQVFGSIHFGWTGGAGSQP